MSVAPDTLHGTAIAVAGRAALIRGPSGSGKSDLALRCLAQPPCPLFEGPALLVADDRVVVSRDGTVAVVSAPPAILGLIEVRGLGIVRVTPSPPAVLALVVDLVADRSAVERMPEPGTVGIAGVRFPRLQIVPFEASAPLKLLLALQRGYPNIHHDGIASL